MTFTTFLKDMFKLFGSNIQLGLPAEIQKFDKQKMRADVKFYLQSEDVDGTLIDYPIITNIPVQFIFAGGFYIRPAYEAGDKVWVSFSTFDIQNALDEYTRVESNGIFTLNNACVSGAIATNKFSVPAEFSESGLLIGHKSGNYMAFGEDKVTFNISGKKVVIDATGILCDGEVVAKNAIPATSVKLSTHMHPTAGTGAPSSPTPGT
jgi:hypothetical protein